MKPTTKSAQASRLTKCIALLAPVLVSMLIAGIPAQVAAKALASAVINIESLVWKWDDNNTPNDRSDDDVLVTVLSGPGSSNLILDEELDRGSVSVAILAGSSRRTDEEFSRLTEADDVDASRRCVGINQACSAASGPNTRYPDNDFDTTKTPTLDAVASTYAYADQLLRNAGSGLRIRDIGFQLQDPLTGGVRAESAQVGQGSATSGNYDVMSEATYSNLPRVVNNIVIPSAPTSFTVTPTASMVDRKTYFELRYSYFALVALENDEGEAAVTLAFALNRGGVDIGWTPLDPTGTATSDLQTVVSGGDGEETYAFSNLLATGSPALYSPDVVFSNTNATDFTLQLATLAATRSKDPVPVPVPGTALLLLAPLALLRWRLARQ